MTKEKECERVGTRSIEEHLPPYRSRSSWENDSSREDKNGRGVWKDGVGWSLTFGRINQRTHSALESTSRMSSTTIWPLLKKIRFTKKQSFACFLVVSFGILPFIMMGLATWNGYLFYYNAFQSKVLYCGNNFLGVPQNSTVQGVEALFVLDTTFGELPFSQAKIIDVAWDIVVGRGVQLTAWWVSYTVFTDALLRVIERHAASYRLFQHMTLEGPCLASAWDLFKSLFRTRSKRTWFLYFYILLSTLYVLSIPAFLGAMSGYDSNTIAWVDVDNTNNIIPASSFDSALIVWGTRNETWQNGSCEASQALRQYFDGTVYGMRQSCSCQAPNGTVMSWESWVNTYFHENWDYQTDCNFIYPGQSGNWTKEYGGDEGTHQCNELHNVTIGNKVYQIENLNYSSGYCHDDTGYHTQNLSDKSRCLPDTANPSYSWGFSTMLSAVFVLLNFIWCITMYIVWQDAQFNSKLVRSGFQMTQLRAVFALTEAAKRRVGIQERDLVRTDTKELDKQLFGTGRKKVKEAEVEYVVFEEDMKEKWEGNGDSQELRKRRSDVSQREV